MPLTPDRKKSAVVGVILSLIGLTVMMYGTTIFPEANQQGHLFPALMAVIFGVLLAVSSLLVFVLPAAVEYLKEGMNKEDL
jgi:uncharacterized Tic20 family protein